jgi:hypothetical protein
MTGFPNTYEDARRAAAYASLAYPGTYHLAFRRGHDTCVGPPALPLLIPGQARRHDEHQGYRQKGGNRGHSQMQQPDERWSLQLQPFRVVPGRRILRNASGQQQAEPESDGENGI